MANGIGSLHVGSSALRNNQHALNITANNLANIDTKGYVRQQVEFQDVGYTKFGNAAIGPMQVGLGVSIGAVVHSRDIFLDKFFRTEAGRQAFHEAKFKIINKVDELFQEMEGAAFQGSLQELWASFQELAKDPSDALNQGLVVQKAKVLMERAQSITTSLRDYQRGMNHQISSSVDRINELGRTIQRLNVEIQKVEAGGVERAMQLRDLRDLALDELSSFANIDYRELPNGDVRVNLEGVLFVDGMSAFQIGLTADSGTGFVTPFWSHLSKPSVDPPQFVNVFSTSGRIDSQTNTDLGSLKAMLLARGDDFANYLNLDVNANTYDSGIGRSVLMNTQAELDRLIHSLATAINDILAPNAPDRITFTDMDGNVWEDVLIWDEARGALGADGNPPGQELFARAGMERYTKVTAEDGTVFYVYNEPDEDNAFTLYTTNNLVINPKLIENAGNMPHLRHNGEIDYDLANRLAGVWEQRMLQLNPNDSAELNFSEFYRRMIGNVALAGSVHRTMASTLSGTVNAIHNQRESVIGVSSDEELQNMIRFQNAYNAASRYINVISEMLEHLVTRVGAR